MAVNPSFDEVLTAAQRRPVRNICTCVHCEPFLDAEHGNGCVGYHCTGSCMWLAAASAPAAAHLPETGRARSEKQGRL